MNSRKEKIVKWLKRIGFAGFMFFLIKGIAWIVIFILVYVYGEEIIPKSCK